MSSIIDIIDQFKEGYASIIDIINSIGVDLIDKDIEDLEKLIKDYKEKK